MMCTVLFVLTQGSASPSSHAHRDQAEVCNYSVYTNECTVTDNYVTHANVYSRQHVEQGLV